MNTFSPTPVKDTPRLRLTPWQQQEIVERLSALELKNMYAVGFMEFARNGGRTSAAYMQLLQEMRQQLMDAPAGTRAALGKNYPFFKNLIDQL